MAAAVTELDHQALLNQCRKERDQWKNLTNLAEQRIIQLAEECDRLRAIADLACAEHEARVKHRNEPVTEGSWLPLATSDEWVIAATDLAKAVAVEVTRRAQH